MKIAQVITRMDWGGSPDIVRITCERLSSLGHDIRLITGLTKNPSRKTNEFLARFSGKTAIIPQLKRDIRLFSDCAALARLYLLFRREKFDVVHTHTAKAGALGRIAANLAGVKVIVHTPHGHNFYGYFNPFFSRLIIIIEKALAFFTARIIALTELERADYLKYGVARGDKVDLIYFGLELDKFIYAGADKQGVKRSLGIKSDEMIVGMVGRLEEVKGPGFFVEAAILALKDFPRAKFFLVGEGSMRCQLEKRVKESGQEEKIIFTGWREDVPEILSILDILVLPSLNEAVGIVLIEAQAEGVAVIASRVGGVAETIKDGYTGTLVPCANPIALARAIEELLNYPEKRKVMGERGRAWVGDRFDAQEMARRISDLYLELRNR